VGIGAGGVRFYLKCGPYLGGATAVSANAGDSVALLSSGAVVDWGEGQDGGLGNGAGTTSTVPVRVCVAGSSGPCPSGPYLSGVTAISAGGKLSNGGDTFVLALLGNGKVEAWGRNEHGELGDGTMLGPETCEAGATKFACSKSPVAVSGLSAVTAVAARGEHASRCRATAPSEPGASTRLVSSATG
jgi:alpha-tubulin suppressor-like RCC1 family protein